MRTPERRMEPWPWLVLLAPPVLAVLLAVIAASLYFPPLLVVLFGGLGYLVFCYHYPLASYAFVVFTFVFKPALLLVPASGTRSTGFVNTLTVADFVLLALVGVLVFKTLFHKDQAIVRMLRSHSLFLLLVALLLLSAVPGLLYAESIPNGIASMLRLVNGMLLGIMGLVYLRSHADIARFASMMMPIFLIACLWGWYEVLTGQYLLQQIGRPIAEQTLSTAEAGYHRAIGPTGDPVYYSVALTFGMAMGLIVFHHAAARWWRWTGIAIMGLCAATIMTTGARGGLLAAFILMAIYFFFVRMRHKMLVLTALGVVLLLGMAIYATTISTLPFGRLAVTGGEKDETTQHRLGLYSQALRMFSDSPLVGVGYGEFQNHQPKYFEHRTPRYTLRPHSVYLQLLAEDGIFAFAIYLTILAWCGLPLFSLVLRLQAPDARITAVILLGLVLAYMFFATNTNLLEDDYVWMGLVLSQVARRALDKPIGSA